MIKIWVNCVLYDHCLQLFLVSPILPLRVHNRGDISLSQIQNEHKGVFWTMFIKKTHGTSYDNLPLQSNLSMWCFAHLKSCSHVPKRASAIACLSYESLHCISAQQTYQSNYLFCRSQVILWNHKKWKCSKDTEVTVQECQQSWSMGRRLSWGSRKRFRAWAYIWKDIHQPDDKAKRWW